MLMKFKKQNQNQMVMKDKFNFSWLPSIGRVKKNAKSIPYAVASIKARAI